MGYKIKRILVGTQQVRPSSSPILEYDFTQSDWWWTKTSTVSRSSSWFYVSWANVDWYIYPPSEIYDRTPKKIQIIFNRPDSNSWTGISNWWNYWYFLPRNYWVSRFDWAYAWTITQNNLQSFGTGAKTWELDIDSSTTNRTITHKITDNNDITDTSWILKYIWDNKIISVRTVHWNTSGAWTYIQKVIINY